MRTASAQVEFPGGRWTDGGPWVVRAFRDEDRNRDWQPAREPASEAVRLELQPAGEVTDLKLELRRRTGAP